MAFKGLFKGIDRYASAEINWSSCATRDAKALHGLYADTLGGGITLLTDEQATVAGIGREPRQAKVEKIQRGSGTSI